jgi:hypothetical protein
MTKPRIQLAYHSVFGASWECRGLTDPSERLSKCVAYGRDPAKAFSEWLRWRDHYSSMNRVFA